MTHPLGHGIYSISEAARLIGVSRPRVAALFRGWRGGAGPMFESDYENQFSTTTLSFLDFVDAVVAATLRDKHNTPPRTIRKLRDVLGEQWKTKHPFGREEFYTDDTGREVFTLLVEGGEQRLIDILRHQYAMSDVLLPFLKRVEYDPDTRMASVFPLTDRVVLDPTRKYGKPIVRGTGMPTTILYECYQMTKDIDIVADWYGVDAADAEEAVAFESGFKGIAA